jgi:N-acetylneuraminic acid mutarotase
MTEARGYGHTATLLPDGTVLVAGGVCSLACSRGALASGELYDPRLGSWTTAGEMIQARANHTATLLADGRVLVAGGAYSSGTGLGGLASAELYDPGNGSWASTGDMDEARYYGHSATLMSNRMVLVAGGGLVEVASAELFDPGSGSWTATGRMNEVRGGHTATLLSGGRVLVAGGAVGSGRPLASGELYDLSSGSWTATASMVEGRSLHTATLLASGEVLVAGGVSGVTGTVPDAMASAELYEPGSGT